MSDHILKVELGEFTAYHLTCNLDDAAPCHQTCQRHPEGGCGEPESEGECITSPYEGGCVVAEWVNDGGIEGVQFEHVLELPVAYHWDGGHDFPILVAQSDESLRADLTTTRQRLKDLTAERDEARTDGPLAGPSLRLSLSEAERWGWEYHEATNSWGRAVGAPRAGSMDHDVEQAKIRELTARLATTRQERDVLLAEIERLKGAV